MFLLRSLKVVIQGQRLELSFNWIVVKLLPLVCLYCNLLFGISDS